MSSLGDGVDSPSVAGTAGGFATDVLEPPSTSGGDLHDGLGASSSSSKKKTTVESASASEAYSDEAYATGVDEEQSSFERMLIEEQKARSAAHGNALEAREGLSKTLRGPPFSPSRVVTNAGTTPVGSPMSLAAPLHAASPISPSSSGAASPGSSSASAVQGTEGLELDAKDVEDIVSKLKSCLDHTESRLYDAFLVISRKLSRHSSGGLTREALVEGLSQLESGVSLDRLETFSNSIKLDEHDLIGFQEFYNVFETGRTNISAVSWSPPRSGTSPHYDDLARGSHGSSVHDDFWSPKGSEDQDILFKQERQHLLGSMASPGFSSGCSDGDDSVHANDSIDMKNDKNQSQRQTKDGPGDTCDLFGSPSYDDDSDGADGESDIDKVLEGDGDLVDEYQKINPGSPRSSSDSALSKRRDITIEPVSAPKLHSETLLTPRSAGGSASTPGYSLYSNDLDGNEAPSLHAAETAVLSVTVHKAESIRLAASPGKSATATDIYISCKVGKDKFKTPVISKSLAPVWNSSHSFGGPKQSSNQQIPSSAEKAYLIVLAKHVDGWRKRSTVGSVAIPIWSLLRCGREHPSVVSQDENSIEVKKWFHVPPPGASDSGDYGVHGLENSGGSRRSLFGISFPGSPVGNKSPLANVTLQSPTGVEPPASLPRILLSLRLTFPGLDKARSIALGLALPLPPPPVAAFSPTSGDGTTSSMQVQQQEQQNKASEVHAESSRDGQELREALLAEHAAALKSQQEAHRRELEATVQDTISSQREREQDLRAELQLMRLELDAYKEGDDKLESTNKASELVAARRQAEGEAAIKRREELEINARLQSQHAHDYKELVFQLRAQITELRREHADEVGKMKQRNTELQRQVGELFETVGSAETSLHMKENAVSRLQQENEELAANAKLQRALKEDMESKLEAALAEKAALQAKIDIDQTRTVNMVAMAGRGFESARQYQGESAPRFSGSTSRPPMSESEEVKQLLETISQLNGAFDVLRASESKAQESLTEANARFHENSLEITKLAAANESQAKELTRVVEDLAKTTEELGNVHNENAALHRKVSSLESDAGRSDATQKIQAQELVSLRERNFKLEGQATVLQEQLSESNDKFLSISAEVVELRRYRTGSTAHLHAQSLTIERMKSGRKDADSLANAIDKPGFKSKFDRSVTEPIAGLRRAVLALKAPVKAFPDAVSAALRELKAFVALRDGNEGHISQAFSILKEQQKSNQEEKSALRPLNLGDARQTYERERQRRRNLLKSGSKIICSVYEKPGSSASLYSSTFSPVASEYEGNAARFDMSIPGDALDAGIQIEPLVHSAELCVPGEGVDRYFAFDQVIVHDKPPSSTSTMSEVAQHATTALGVASNQGNKSDSRHHGSLREHLYPVADGLFDGDKAVVVATGPGASVTTQSIINAVFDVVENLGPKQNLDGSLGPDAGASCMAEPRISISCVDVHGNDVFDMLANPSPSAVDLGSGSPDPSENGFERLDFDRAAARATGRVNLEAAGLSIVEVRSRYEASLVTAMGSGNRAAVSASRNILDGENSPCESHMVLTISIESVDPFSGAISAGKLHVVELSSSPAQSRQGQADDSLDALAQVATALSPDMGNIDQQEQAAMLSARSSGALSRLFSRGVLLGVLRDCIDQEALGISALSRTSFAHGAGSDLPQVGEGQNLFHLLVHVSLITSNPRNADLLSALSFARRVRTSGPDQDIGIGGTGNRSVQQHQHDLESPAPLLSLPGSTFDSNRKRSPTKGHSPTGSHSMLSSSSVSSYSKQRSMTRQSKDRLVDEDLRTSRSSNNNVSKPPMRNRRLPAARQPPIARKRKSNADLTRAMTRVITALMDQTSEGMLHTLFLSMDTGRTGYLSRQQFRTGIHKIDPTLTKREIELFMDSMDAKSDGKIDFQEFFRTLGDAKTASNSQHVVPVSDARAYPIVMRERQRIREQLSPNNVSPALSPTAPTMVMASSPPVLPAITVRTTPTHAAGVRVVANSPPSRSPNTPSYHSPPGSASSPQSHQSSLVSSSSHPRVDYLLGWTPPVQFDATLRR